MFCIKRSVKIWNSFWQARALLDAVTPLQSDCGIFCNAACCQGEDTDGMALLPNEAALYHGAAWCRVLTRNGCDILICDGTCPRQERPFSCRIFPLYAHVTSQRAMLQIDPFARAVCPLCAHGMRAFDRHFIQNAREALQLLLTRSEYRTFFMQQTQLRLDALHDPLFQIGKEG